jgi:hypothetical protein
MRRSNIQVTLFQTPIVLLIHILNVGVPPNMLTLDQRAFEENASTVRKAHMEAELAVRFILRDILTQVAAQCTVAKKVGRCSSNKGAQKRAARSLKFKQSCILDYDELKNMWPSENVSVLVASCHGINKNLLNTWLRKRKEIFEATALTAKRTQKGFQPHAQKIRRQKGRFAEAEAEVYRLFTVERQKGKRMGPRWLCQCARREVRTNYHGTPLEEAASKFDAKNGWLRRFCSRFRISLRRKTNCKKVPVLLRLGKLKRYFALFRLRLLSFINQPGYDPVWSLFPLKQRWSLDQVPAGFHAPTSTYEHVGAKRVLICSNKAADDHRTCTLQVCIRAEGPQPPLVICFKGTGARIKEDEKAAYYKGVIVQWDKKAWYCT